MRLDNNQIIKPKKHTSPIDSANSVDDTLVTEFENFEQEYLKLEATLDAAKTDEEKAAILQPLLDETGLTIDQLGGLFARIEQGENPDTVLQDGLDLSLNTFLKVMMDETDIPDGYRQMDEFIKIEMFDNGSMVNNYQDYLPVDSINPFVGSQKGDPNGDWTQLTVSDGEFAAMESYGVSHIVHKKALVYASMFTSVHKTAAFFAKQLNFLKKKVGQPILDVLLAIKTKLLLNNFEGEDAIKDTKTGVIFEATDIGTPDIEFTGTSMASVIGQFNSWERGLETASRKHNPVGSKAEALFGVSFDKGKTQTQLKRSARISDFKVITPLKFIEAYDKGILAGAFNMDKAEINAVKSTLRPRNLELLCSEEYANITGVKTDLLNGDLMQASGSADLFVMANDPFVIIQKFKSSNIFKLPNNTSAVNTWFNWGLGIHKWEDKFFFHVRLTVTPENQPQPPVVNPKVTTTTYDGNVTVTTTLDKTMENPVVNIDNGVTVTSSTIKDTTITSTISAKLTPDADTTYTVTVTGADGNATFEVKKPVTDDSETTKK